MGKPTFGEPAVLDPTIARLLADDFDDDTLSAAALALAVEDLIPRAEIATAVGPTMKSSGLP